MRGFVSVTRSNLPVASLYLLSGIHSPKLAASTNSPATSFSGCAMLHCGADASVYLPLLGVLAQDTDVPLYLASVVWQCSRDVALNRLQELAEAGLVHLATTAEHEVTTPGHTHVFRLQWCLQLLLCTKLSAADALAAHRRVASGFQTCEPINQPSTYLLRHGVQQHLQVSGTALGFAALLVSRLGLVSGQSRMAWSHVTSSHETLLDAAWDVPRQGLLAEFTRPLPMFQKQRSFSRRRSATLSEPYSSIALNVHLQQSSTRAEAPAQPEALRGLVLTLLPVLRRSASASSSLTVPMQAQLSQAFEHHGRCQVEVQAPSLMRGAVDGVGSAVPSIVQVITTTDPCIPDDDLVVVAHTHHISLFSSLEMSWLQSMVLPPQPDCQIIGVSACVVPSRGHTLLVAAATATAGGPMRFCCWQLAGPDRRYVGSFPAENSVAEIRAVYIRSVDAPVILAKTQIGPVTLVMYDIRSGRAVAQIPVPSGAYEYWTLNQFSTLISDAFHDPVLVMAPSVFRFSAQPSLVTVKLAAAYRASGVIPRSMQGHVSVPDAAFPRQDGPAMRMLRVRPFGIWATRAILRDDACWPDGPGLPDGFAVRARGVDALILLLPACAVVFPVEQSPRLLAQGVCVDVPMRFPDFPVFARDSFDLVPVSLVCIDDQHRLCVLYLAQETGEWLFRMDVVATCADSPKSLLNLLVYPHRWARELRVIVPTHTRLLAICGGDLL